MLRQHSSLWILFFLSTLISSSLLQARRSVLGTGLDSGCWLDTRPRQRLG